MATHLTVILGTSQLSVKTRLKREQAFPIRCKTNYTIALHFYPNARGQSQVFTLFKKTRRKGPSYLRHLATSKVWDIYREDVPLKAIIWGRGKGHGTCLLDLI